MSYLSELQESFPHFEWLADTPLAPYTYMKVGGPADILWEAKKLSDFTEVVAFCWQKDIPVTILGGASNVLVADEGIRGLVILNQCSEVALLAETELSGLIAESWWADALRTLTDHECVVAESGVKTAALVRFAVSNTLAGLEPFLGVPGTLGGAIYNNSHYTNELIGEFVLAVEVLGRDGGRYWLSQEQCAFAYDDSRFHRTEEVILRVLFALPVGERSESDALLKEATIRRATSQPLGVPSSGCMFRNVELPEEKQAEYDGKTVLSAGWLIDQAGLKGTRVGGAVVSDKHANFIVNEGGATAADIEELVKKVQEAVQEKFGITLEREVFFIGK